LSDTDNIASGQTPAAPSFPVVPPAPLVPPTVPAPIVPDVPEVQGAFAAQWSPSLCREAFQHVSTEMHRVIVGQDRLIEQMYIAILSGGHILLEGVPGLAKTLAVRTMSRVFDTSFARIQFTPDMMPSDILGTSVFDPKTQEFHFRPGPIFAGLILADEINRTPPKTQSALLEAMEERKVTIDGVQHTLPTPFLVCATQNPIEYEGTYPLPEAQLDRFMLKVNLDYPEERHELELLSRVKSGFRAQSLEDMEISAVLKPEQLIACRQEAEQIRVEDSVLKYILDICRATRTSRHVLLGASPRAAITLLLTTRVLAAVRGRAFVTPDDVRDMCTSVLGHRLILNPESEREGFSIDRVLELALQSVQVPR
jgi:MoxR-like ATPase